MIIWLCLWFSSIFFREISQNFHSLWKLSCQSFKSRKKNRSYKGCFLAICNFVYASSISNLVLWIFLLTGVRKDTNMLNGLANLANSTEGNARNSIDPYFLCRQTLCNGIEICQDRYMSMRRLSNRGPRVYVCHVCFGLAKFLDIKHKQYWASVALYSMVSPCKIIKYIPLSDSFRGIFVSIIEILHYGK